MVSGSSQGSGLGWERGRAPDPRGALDPAIGPHQPRGQPDGGQPIDGKLAADDRRRGRGVRIDARRCGHGHGAPHLAGGTAGARVDHVVDGLSTQPFIGASPATAMSTPRLTSTPHRVISAAATAARSAASAFAVAPRSGRRPIGTRMRELVRSISTNRPPGAGCGPMVEGPLGSTAAKSRSYPSTMSASPTVGSTSPSVSAAAQMATSTELRSDGLMSFLTRARYFPCLFLILARIFGLLGGRKRDGATGGGRAELNAAPGIRSRRCATACPRARSRNSGRTLCRTVACLPRTAARTRRSCPAPSPGRS